MLFLFSSPQFISRTLLEELCIQSSCNTILHERYSIDMIWHDDMTIWQSNLLFLFQPGAFRLTRLWRILYLACLPLWFSCSGSCVSYSYWEHKLKVTGVLFHYFPYFWVTFSFYILFYHVPPSVKPILFPSLSHLYCSTELRL